jgi:glycosyltransferase involved in cell wall biosynthesis
MNAAPARPSVRSRSSSARIAATVWRASGPDDPAFRYALCSSTGNWPRASSNVTRGILPGSGLTFPAMRVVIADPPAYTPPYDRSLATALASAGADVELVTSRFRFGEVQRPLGYSARQWFYPLSSQMGSSRMRLAVKALEHPVGMAQLAMLRPDILHVQWFGAPEADRWLFRPRSPVVYTAHDVIPRRTASKTAIWRTLFSRIDRVVVHSEHGRESLAAFGIPGERVRVVPHPAFRADVVRADDGRTALALGLIRPYKGTEDAVEAVLRARDSRLLVAGDPRIELDGLRARAGERVEWRLGFLPAEEIRRALSEATVALFPYRAEIDVSGALLQVLGAGIPAVVYDIGGLGEVVGRYGAGAVVAPGDVAAMSAAVERLFDDPASLEKARAGADRAREELTWEASAAAHLELYRELA